MKKSDLYQRFTIKNDKVTYTERNVVYTIYGDFSREMDKLRSDKGFTVRELKNLAAKCKRYYASKYYINTNKKIYK